MSSSRETNPHAPVRTLVSNGAEETEAVGRAMAGCLVPGDLVAVSGDLGAGKSVLCRAIVRALMRDDALEVPSPSYTLVNVYEHADFQIWHADLYRIGDESELGEIGIEDAVKDAVVLVEWPERWTGLPDRRVHVCIRVLGDDERSLRLTFGGGGWERLIARLEAFA